MFPRGDSAFATSTDEELWRVLEGADEFEQSHLDVLVARAGEVTPPEVYPDASMLHGYAQLAMFALTHAIRSFQPGDRTQDAIAAASQLQHIAMLYIEDRDNLNYNIESDRKRLQGDPLMQAELRRQREDLALLAGDEDRARLLKELRYRAVAGQVIDPEKA
jgi:hypothetical protein